MHLPESKLVKSQKIKTMRTMDKERLIVTLRHDDECGNGHNTFAVTAELEEYRGDWWHWAAGGMLHEEIKKFFPELVPYLKWHLCSTDGPMHYLANSLYHASDKDHWGLRKGEPHRFDHAVRFGMFPVTFKLNTAFAKWLQGLENYDLEVMAVHHPPDEHNYKFAPKYTLLPYSADKWHTCPFDTEQEALEFLEALQHHTPHFVKIATSWGAGKEPDLAAARESAIWPEAELSDFTEEKLLARLPALMDEFKAAVESLGLTY